MSSEIKYFQTPTVWQGKAKPGQALSQVRGLGLAAKSMNLLHTPWKIPRREPEVYCSGHVVMTHPPRATETARVMP